MTDTAEAEGFGPCTKHRYESREAAYRVLVSLPDRRRRWLRVYQCDRCAGWHLGRPTRNQRARLRQERHPHDLTLADVWDPDDGWHRPEWVRATREQRHKIEQLSGRYPEGIDNFSTEVADDIIEALDAGKMFRLRREEHDYVFRPLPKDTGSQ